MATEKNIWRVRAASKREKGGFWAEETKQESSRLRKMREAVGKGKKKSKIEGEFLGETKRKTARKRESFIGF